MDRTAHPEYRRAGKGCLCDIPLGLLKTVDSITAEIPDDDGSKTAQKSGWCRKVVNAVLFDP
jgi:hypothetical protein